MTMAFSTLMLTVFGVFASELIFSLGIERWQVGILVAASTFGGALLSLPLGKWADKVGGRRATTLTLLIAGFALLGVGVAPGYSLMVGAAVLTGIPAATSNPSTNKLISEEMPPGRQGLIVGVKQSGMPVGIFLGGWLLPVFALWWGWRWAVMVFAVVPVVVAVFYWMRSAPAPVTPLLVSAVREEGVAGMPTGRLPRLIYRLAIYGFLLGLGATTVLTYLPLYAEEALGMSRGQSGLVLAFSGLIGILGRIGWGHLAEGRLGWARSLMTIALLSALLGVVLAFGPLLGTWAIWLAGMLFGISGSSWTSVGMLAVIQILPTSLAGRGSGVVFFGFLSGAAVGPPLLGWSVDVLGVYTPGWLAVAALFGVGFWIIYTIRKESGIATPLISGA